jgi:geranylgeranyl reductase family protein
MIYDAIVVGSGPGGALAAANLATSGKSVLLVDRQAFPRDKACGDSLSFNAMGLLRELDLDIRQLFKFNHIQTKLFKLPDDSTLLRNEESTTSPRYYFDHMLHEYAIRQGASFEIMDVEGPLFSNTGNQDNRPIVGIIERKGKTYIEHEAKVIIAADGASSRLAHAVDSRLRQPAETLVAIRAYGRSTVPIPPHYFFETHPSLMPGYGWVFPLSPTEVNIGIGAAIVDPVTLKQRKINLKQHLAAFQERLHPEYILEIDPDSVKSWSLPIWQTPESRVKQGVFLVGDAGRFVDPFTGEGIYEAMLTGHLAGKYAAQVIDNIPQAHKNYDREWRMRLSENLQRSVRMYQYFNQRYAILQADLEK